MRFPAETVRRLRPAYEGRAVCVTGGAGFIGSHLVDALLSLGAMISVIDDLSNASADHIAELIDLEPERVRFVHGSVLDDRALAEALAGCGVVFHLAAMGSVARSVAEPERCFAVNATGTVRVLEASRRLGAARLVYSSSSSVYGDAPGMPRRESQVPAPLSPYACSKLAAEHAVRAWAHSYGISGVSLRYFNVFGPRQPADSAYAAVIPAFCRRILAGEPPVIFGDGLQARDFTFVANAVIANVLAGASHQRLLGQAVNIGTGRRTDLLELARLIAQRSGAELVPARFEPARPGDVRESQADTALARELLGFEPLIPLEAGLDETIAWCRRAGAGAERREA